MKTIHSIHFAFILMLIGGVLCLSSCEGPEGPAGPAGQPGIQGIQGAVGPAGPAGQQGPAGNSNVIASSWINLVWEVRSPVFIGHFLIPAPELTAERVANASVLVYIDLGGNSNPIKLLPCPVYDGVSGRINFIIDLLLRAGSFDIYHRAPLLENTGANSSFPNARVRYVIIPPGVGGRIALPDVSDYFATCKYLGIEP